MSCTARCADPRFRSAAAAALGIPSAAAGEGAADSFLDPPEEAGARMTYRILILRVGRKDRKP